jgi:hypothetical protein
MTVIRSPAPSTESRPLLVERDIKRLVPAVGMSMPHPIDARTRIDLTYVT